MTQLDTAVEPTEKKRIHKPEELFAKGKSRLITVNEVAHRVGFGQSTIFAKIAKDEFVKPIKVKTGVTRWLESDIDQWIDDLVAANK